MPLVVSVDVEDWPQSTWDHSLPITERARRNTEHFLDIAAASGRKVTCFVLGKFAERFPACVQRMAADGHEVASHGYGHIEVFRQAPAEFREDVRRSKRLLEELTGRSVAGYRAPDFSITRRSLWALEILATEGFQYDSSIYPIRHGRYGIPGWPVQPVRVRLPSSDHIVQLPLATVEALGRRWPVAGGGYHRLLPWWLIRWAIRRTLKAGGTFVSYCHPYEFDPDEFRTLSFPLPLKRRLHQGLGRGGFEAKFIHLLGCAQPVFAQTAASTQLWPTHDLAALTTCS